MAKKKVAEKGEPKDVMKCDTLYEVSQNHNNLPASVTQNMEFPKEMHDMFQKVAEHYDAQFRLCKTLVAAFKATNEQDLSYMDGYMDTLFDFMDPGGDTEALYREYLAHVATFNPQKAKEYEESLDEHLGYKVHVVFAAAYVARDLHQGQKDKVMTTLVLTCFLWERADMIGKNRWWDYCMMLQKIHLTTYLRFYV